MRRSPERGTFSMERYKKKLLEDPTDEHAIAMVNYYKNSTQLKLDLEETDEWRINNMEYDLRTSELIIEKCNDRVYAQHLYASMCNNEFVKNEVWPILSDKRWSCSWRYAGGIVADIRQEGDYIDWYCSGIRNENDLDESSFRELTEEQKLVYLEAKAYVAESVVTDEIRQDLLAIGWLVVDSEEQVY